MCLLHIVLGPVAAERLALGYWGEAIECRDPAAHVPRGPDRLAFADPSGFNKRGPTAHGPQHYTTTYNVINKGAGFRACSGVGKEDARGGGCVSAFAP